MQSTLTSFKYLRKIWKDNAEEERLLGVSLTGIMDHPVLSGRGYLEGNWFSKELADPVIGGNYSLREVLLSLKKVSRETNDLWADMLGINRSKQLTLIIL